MDFFCQAGIKVTIIIITSGLLHGPLDSFHSRMWPTSFLIPALKGGGGTKCSVVGENAVWFRSLKQVYFDQCPGLYSPSLPARLSRLPKPPWACPQQQGPLQPLSQGAKALQQVSAGGGVSVRCPGLGGGRGGKALLLPAGEDHKEKRAKGTPEHFRQLHLYSSRKVRNTSQTTGCVRVFPLGARAKDLVYASQCDSSYLPGVGSKPSAGHDGQSQVGTGGTSHLDSKVKSRTLLGISENGCTFCEDRHSFIRPNL